MAYGSVVTTELVPDGENIPVTKENRNGELACTEIVGEES